MSYAVENKSLNKLRTSIQSSCARRDLRLQPSQVNSALRLHIPYTFAATVQGLMLKKHKFKYAVSHSHFRVPVLVQRCHSHQFHLYF
jgi:hypothetical protein